MKVLLLGSTGMLGQTLLTKLQSNNYSVITSSRNNSNYNIDLLKDSNGIYDIIIMEKPEIVINAAAIVNLKYCESYPEAAYIINSRLPAIITEASKKTKSYFVQISTDHYYPNDIKMAHNEEHEISLVNEYARTKFAGESFALTSNNSLVVRTNIVGFRNKKEKPTFVEWVIQSFESNIEVVGFEGFYTSSIDVLTFSDILLELIENRLTGIFNIASSDIFSKYEFINSLAILMNKEKYVKKGNAEILDGVVRARNLGLDISKLNSVLKQNKIPSLKEVIKNLYSQYKEGAFHELQK